MREQYTVLLFGCKPIVILICTIGFIFALVSFSNAIQIEEIKISGAKTKDSVILGLLDSKVSDNFDPKVWEADQRRIKNNEIFYDVHTTTSSGTNGKILHLHLKNKFSTIPIFKFKQGGGTSQLTAGIYDVNLFNRYLEAGAQYEKMNEKNGFVTWFRHPYFFSRKNKLGGEVYVHTFNLPLLTLKGNQEAHIDNLEIRWNLRLQRNLRENLSIKLEGSIYKNTFEEENSTTEKLNRNKTFKEQHALRNGQTVSLSPAVTWGVIDRDEFYISGQEITLEGEMADRFLGSDFNFIRGELSHIAGFRPKRKLNIATQFRIGSKSGREFQHKFYLGGLDSIRGFIDGQFRGEHVWQSNIEVRPTLIERSKWVLQGNIFTDLSKTWDSTNFGIDGFADPFISYGVGARIIFPTIYRAVFRIDIARTQQPVRQFGISLGLQQFF